MQRRKRRAWFPEERAILDRFVSSVAAGRFDTLAAATRACLSELEKVRMPGAPARGKGTVCSYLQRKTWPSRLRSANSFWTSEEQAVVDRCVKALIAGRYRTALKAAEACEKELTRLPTRPVVPRTRQAIFIRIAEGARAAGRNSHRIHWAGPNSASLSSTLGRSPVAGLELAELRRQRVMRRYGSSCRSILPGRALPCAGSSRIEHRSLAGPGQKRDSCRVSARFWMSTRAGPQLAKVSV